MLLARLLFSVVVFGLFAFLQISHAQTGGAPGGKPVPKLVLFMVVDGFPQEQLVKYYDQYGERGFKLLLDKGGWYGNNHYSHATTYTGVGHATLLSCAHPYKHGVVGNDWIDKATGKRLYSTEDARHKYLDEETPQHAGTSPFNMKVTTVGDELIYANAKSKVIAISGKDRSAIGLAGQNGTAYMHSTVTGRFITSDYYMADYPAWWKAFYAAKPQDKYYGQTWSLLLPEESYAARPSTTGRGPQRQGPGNALPPCHQRRRRQARQGLLRRHDVDAVGRPPDLRLREGGDRGGELGSNPAGVPDILAISWTSHDYVNHCSARKAGSRTIRRCGSTASSPSCSSSSTAASACRTC